MPTQQPTPGISYPYKLDVFDQWNYWKPQPIKKDTARNKKRIKKKGVNVDKMLRKMI
jgi:hypothetical protein